MPVGFTSPDAHKPLPRFPAHRRFSGTLGAACSMAVLSVLPHFTIATTLKWDADGNPTVGTPVTATPGSGTWSTAAANWYNNTSDIGWTNSSTALAQFGGSGGASGNYSIAVDPSVTTAQGILFTTDGFKLSGASPVSIALATDGVEVDGVGATIGNNISLGGITKLANDAVAAGTLTLESGSSASSSADMSVTATPGSGAFTLDVKSGATLTSGRIVLNSETKIAGNASFSGTAIFVSSTANANTRLQISGAGTVAGTSSTAANGYLQFGPTNAFTGSATGTLDLDGGTLTVNQIKEGVATSQIASTVNLNGGIIKVKTGAPNAASFMTGLDTANVKASGAKFDTNNVATTVRQPLLHDAGLGTTLDGGLEKLGPGTLTLSGVSTYTGTTTVTTGTLKLTGTIDASAGIKIASGAVFDLSAKASGYTVNGLSGSGTVAGVQGQSVTLSANSTLAPGDGAGTLVIGAGNLSLAGGTTYQYEIGGTRLAPTSDRVNLTGPASTVSLSSTYTLALAKLGTIDPTGKTFVLFDSVSPIASAGSWTFDYGTTGWSGGSVLINPTDNTQVILTSIAVPEPACLSLLLTTGLLITGRRPRRRLA